MFSPRPRNGGARKQRADRGHREERRGGKEMRSETGGAEEERREREAGGTEGLGTTNGAARALEGWEREKIARWKKVTAERAEERR